MNEKATSRPPRRPRRRSFLRRRWVWVLAVVLGIPLVIGTGVLGCSYRKFARVVDERLHGEQARVVPHIYARPMEIRRAQRLTQPQVIDRLNDLGYAERPDPAQAGEFGVARGTITII
ncbi:MAG: hypothetical protein IMZ55_04825, partial [Acidobacteria bacterium]|nr:hypothetical protein [Acidobacteriota bacterium]